MNPSNIVQLPDGSACFTAEVMSKEEAMALPINKRPICYRVSSELYHDVFQAIAEASNCWKPDTGSAVFQSERASDVAVRLLLKIADEKERAVSDALLGKRPAA